MAIPSFAKEAAGSTPVVAVSIVIAFARPEIAVHDGDLGVHMTAIRAFTCS
jgi:hypothetical protein